MLDKSDELMVQVEGSRGLINRLGDDARRGDLRTVLPTAMKSVHQQ